MKGEKSCKNGGKCTKGKCSCPDGFKGDLCEEQFYRTETKIQKALKIQGNCNVIIYKCLRLFS